MSQSTQSPLKIETSPDKLPGLPSKPLSTKQQLEALKRVQDQAEKRVKLGMRLYKAAEAHVTQRQSLIDEFKGEQARLKEELQEDITRSLHAYDQWVGKIDHDFTHAMRDLEGRIDDLQTQWGKSQRRIDQMVRRSEKLLDQSRIMVSATARSVAAVTASKQQASLPAQTAESAEVAAARSDEPADAVPDDPEHPSDEELTPRVVVMKAIEAEPITQSASTLYQQIIEKMETASPSPPDALPAPADASPAPAGSADTPQNSGDDEGS